MARQALAVLNFPSLVHPSGFLQLGRGRKHNLEQPALHLGRFASTLFMALGGHRTKSQQRCFQDRHKYLIKHQQDLLDNEDTPVRRAPKSKPNCDYSS